MYPTTIVKDLALLLLHITLITTLTLENTVNISHPDNAIEVNMSVTPAHIVPEWYFLTFYSVLKTLPNIITGIVAFVYSVLVTSVSATTNTSELSAALFPAIFILHLALGSRTPNRISLRVGRISIGIGILLVGI